MRSLLLQALVVLFMTLPACGDSDSSEPTLSPEDIALGERLEALADAYVAERIEPGDPGLAYVVIGPRGVIAEGAYGLANLEEGLPVTLDTPFEIGSVAKPFTAMAVMILVEEGRLALDDSIVNELPEAPEEWDGITIEQLLLHTSGIRNLEVVPFATREDWTNEDILSWAITEPLGDGAGETFSYTNTGYALLALIVERASDQPFDVFMQERIFEPLGMNGTGVDPVWPPDIPDRAVSYINDLVIDVDGGGTGWAAQHSTIEDMKRWEAELRDVTLVSPETLAEIYTAHVPAPTDVEGSRFFACGYGYGWDICDQENLPPEVGHTGELSTFHAWHRRFPEEEMALVFFTNGNDSNGNGNWGFAFADELAEAYFE